MSNRFLYFLIYNVLFLLYINISFADSLPNRIVEVSAKFLNKPYLADPLGEGPQGKFSQKPLYRFDAFDCQTYVETVMALSLSHTMQQFQQQLLQIRYSNGKPDFYTRNHFPGIDWIPHNIQKKYIIYSPLNTDSISIIIDKQQWFNAKTQRKNPSIPSRIKVTLPYIALSRVPFIIDKIPDSAIIMIVRPTFLLISHTGFAVWKNNVLYLREASSYHHKVTDVPLLEYLQAQAHYGVKGIVVLIPQDNRQQSP
jgi:hypothetical protein